MNLISVSKKALDARRARASPGPTWVGLTLASLVAVVSAGSWILLILGAR